MTQEQALEALKPLFAEPLIWRYVAQAETTHGPDYWARFDSAAALIADVTLYVRALELELEPPPAEGSHE